jgi:hypothetical protein
MSSPAKWQRGKSKGWLPNLSRQYLGEQMPMAMILIFIAMAH